MGSIQSKQIINIKQKKVKENQGKPSTTSIVSKIADDGNSGNEYKI